MVSDLLGQGGRGRVLAQEPRPDVGEHEPGFLAAFRGKRHPISHPLVDPGGARMDAQLVAELRDQLALGEEGGHGVIQKEGCARRSGEGA